MTMQLSPMDYAVALYLAARDLSDRDAKEATARLTSLMASRGKAGLLPAVVAALPDAAASCEGIAKVAVETAHETDATTVKAALKALGIDETAAEVVTAVRPELIGGIRIRHEDRVYDATVKKRLGTLKAALSGNHA